MELIIFGHWLQSRIVNWRQFSLRRWFRHVTLNAVASIVSWAFRSKKVQEAFLETVRCSTPIGQALNAHIEDLAGDKDINANDIHGLGDEVEEIIERMDRDREIDVENIKDFEQEVQRVVEGAMDEFIDVPESMIKLTLQRLSY